MDTCSRRLCAYAFVILGAFALTAADDADADAYYPMMCCATAMKRWFLRGKLTFNAILTGAVDKGLIKIDTSLL